MIVVDRICVSERFSLASSVHEDGQSLPTFRDAVYEVAFVAMVGTVLVVEPSSFADKTLYCIAQ